LVPGSSPGGPSYSTVMDIYQDTGRYKYRIPKIEERFFQRRVADKKATLFCFKQKRSR